MTESSFLVSPFTFPFMGSLTGEHEIFQYFLLKSSEETVSFFIPKWVTHRYFLKEWDLINLYLPLQARSHIVFIGRIEEVTVDEKTESHIYHLSFLEQKESSYYFYPLSSPLFLDASQSNFHIEIERSTKEDLLLQAIKDCFLIKRSIQVYFQHLIPYFSRVTEYSEETFPMFKEYILQDIQKRIEDHMKQLQALYLHIMDQKSKGPLDLIDLIDPEYLIQIVQSEINPDLLNLSFPNKSHIPYIAAIKQLEELSYWNHNLVVLLVDLTIKEEFWRSNPKAS